MIKVSDYIMNFLADEGVKDVFYLSGGGCMHLVDSLGRCERLMPVANLHEQCCAIAAGGYGQYTENLGVCLVTTGPGGTNAITGVTAAWIDSTPMIVLSGQVKRADLMTGKGVRQMGPQEVDLISMIKPITKYAVRVMDPMKIREHLEEAVYLARTGRKGPVWLEIPLDIQGAIVDETKLMGYQPPTEEYVVPQVVEEVYKLINESKRPVIIAGVGIRAAKALESFEELITKLNIPVLTTWRALDFIEEEHPLYFGRPGAVGQRGANFIQQNCDLLISIGARLDLGQLGFNYKYFAREAKKVVVDIDQAEIDKIETTIDVPVNCSADTFINEMNKNSNLLQNVKRSEWLSRCKKWKEKYPVVLQEYKENKAFVNTYDFVDELSKQLDKDAIIVPGSSGTCSEITCQAIKIKKGQRLINSPGLGSMGFGVAESIGVCIASGQKQTICIIGDGGLQHNIQELELLRRYELPIKLFVLNNSAYASIRLMQKRIFGGNLVGCDKTSGVTIPDTLAVAQAYKLPTMQITQHDDIERVIKATFEKDGPVVCEVMVDPDMQTAPRLSSVAKPDGRMVSKPLEDLWPFLERKEFMENMIIKPLDEE